MRSDVDDKGYWALHLWQRCTSSIKFDILKQPLQPASEHGVTCSVARVAENGTVIIYRCISLPWPQSCLHDSTILDEEGGCRYYQRSCISVLGARCNRLAVPGETGRTPHRLCGSYPALIQNGRAILIGRLQTPRPLDERVSPTLVDQPRLITNTVANTLGQ